MDRIQREVYLISASARSFQNPRIFLANWRS
jgi:hypothetical protein